MDHIREGGLIMTESLNIETVEALFNALPVEVSFVDENDQVRYFNKNGNRIFPRSKGILGLKVQKCHPEKSIQKVVQILEAFKSEKRDTAEFWINLEGRLIYIRYFCVRDKQNKYLGTLEVTQDITDIQKIKGEKRLLDWK
jgi:PAS domain S-box-containing protein